jgi:hypothetical protein
VEECIVHTDEGLRRAAMECMGAFLGGYACSELLPHVPRYCELLVDHVPARRIGGALALAALPAALAAPQLRVVLQALSAAVNAATARERTDVDARVAAIEVQPPVPGMPSRQGLAESPLHCTLHAWAGCASYTCHMRPALHWHCGATMPRGQGAGSCVTGGTAGTGGAPGHSVQDWLA